MTPTDRPAQIPSGAMRNPLKITIAASVAAIAAVAITACGPAEPKTNAAPTTVSSSAEPSTGPAQTDSTTGADASALIDSAAKSARILRSVHVEFSTTGVLDLLAQSYVADVTTSPAVASRGSANLKINGAYTQTDYRTVDGKLWIKGKDGKFTDMGPARGKFDPAVLLDPQRGLAALVAGVENGKIDGTPAQLNGKEAVKVTGMLAAESAKVLLPREALGDVDEVPVTVWLAPNAPNDLIQLILKTKSGTVTLRMSKGEPFTVAAP